MYKVDEDNQDAGGSQAGSVQSVQQGGARGTAVTRLTKGFLANIVGQVIAASGQLVLVPVFLACWGKQLYGEWLLLSAATAYVALCDFGMQMFVVNRMNQCYARGDVTQGTRILHSALLTSVLVCGIVLAILVPGVFLAPLEKWLHLTITSHVASAIIACVLMFQILVTIPYGLVAGVYRATGEYARGQMAQNTSAMLSLCFTVTVVVLGGTPVYAASAQLAAVAIVMIFVTRDLSKRQHHLQPGFRQANLRLGLSLVGPSLLFALIQVAFWLTVQGSVLIVGSLFGAVAVAVFVPCRTLGNLIRQVIAAFTNAIWPEWTTLDAEGKRETLRTMLLLASKTFVALSVSLSAFLYLAGAPILLAWTRHRVEADLGLINAVLGLVTFQSPWLASSLLLAASNRLRALACCYLGAAVFGLGAGLIAGRAFGPAGVVWGMCAGELLICGTILPWMACRAVGQSLASFAAQVYGRGAVLAGVVFIAVDVSRRWLLVRTSLGSALLLGACAFVVSLSLAAVLGFHWGQGTSLRKIVALGRLKVSSAFSG